MKEIERELVSAGFVVGDIYMISYVGIRVPGWVPQIPLIGLPIVCADIRAITK